MIHQNITSAVCDENNQKREELEFHKNNLHTDPNIALQIIEEIYKKMFGEEERDACTMDGAHPNDLGFYLMAKSIFPYMKEALKMNTDKMTLKKDNQI